MNLISVTSPLITCRYALAPVQEVRDERLHCLLPLLRTRYFIHYYCYYTTTTSVCLADDVGSFSTLRCVPLYVVLETVCGSRADILQARQMAAWRSGNIVGRINEVTLRRARLVLGWVTVFGG